MAILSCQPAEKTLQIGKTFVIEKENSTIFTTSLDLPDGESVTVTFTSDSSPLAGSITAVDGEMFDFQNVRCKVSIGEEAKGDYTVKVNPDSGDPIEEAGAFTIVRTAI